jgi:hypothetical protein
MNLSRRDMLTLAAAGVAAAPMARWFEPLARAAAPPGGKAKKHCILLWMPGGPSQIDTFDPKPEHKNGGPFKAIKTRTPGMMFAEHLPKVAAMSDHLAVVRSMTTKEGDHGRAAFEARTGYVQQGPIDYPTMGSFVSKQLADDCDLPPCVSISSLGGLFYANSPGFLGPAYTPLIVGNGFGGAPAPLTPEAVERMLRVEHMTPPAHVSAAEARSRVSILKGFDADFVKRHPGHVGKGYQAAYDRAARLMASGAKKAFDLGEEKSSLRDAYGRNLFGQGCLLARRLIERGVGFVEVALTNNVGFPWDTHGDNFSIVRNLCGMLDPAFAALLADLKERGLLDSTLIIWMGEFGRTPRINGARGRDHWPNAWTAVLAGGGVKGGQAVGKTGDDGMEVSERPTKVPDLLATACMALGIDPAAENMATNGRPIRLVDKSANPITEAVKAG